MKPDQLTDLRRFGNMMSSHYGGPVFWVGSSLLLGEEARDCDVRTYISDADFAMRYEPSHFDNGLRCQDVVERWVEQMRTGLYMPLYWRWADEMLKYSRKGSRQTALNIDFQVSPESEWRKYTGHGRYRLDTRDYPLDLAVTFLEGLAK